MRPRVEVLVLEAGAVVGSEADGDMHRFLAVLPADHLAMVIEPGELGTVRGWDVISNGDVALREPCVDRHPQRRQPFPGQGGDSDRPGGSLDLADAAEEVRLVQ